MGGKKKFKPVITRVKLNPEQAVLSCCDTLDTRAGLFAGNRKQCHSSCSLGTTAGVST